MKASIRTASWQGLVLVTLASGVALAPGSVGAAGKPKQAAIDALVLAQQIDRAVQQRLDADKTPASPLAGDAEFQRRVSLDITGTIPTPEKAAAFLDSWDPDKRAKLIDELLASPRYGRHMADIWQGLMLPVTSDNRVLKREPFGTWLAERFNNGTSWDKLVYDLLTASGSQDANGAVSFYLANPTADKVTDQVSRLFLGVQLQCAQCHNHPFTKWKQDEYWGMAAFFTKFQADRVRAAARQATSPGVKETPRPGPRNKLPESAKVVPPKFLQGDAPKLTPTEPYRPVVAQWITSPENPYFARAMVNRLWGQFFGRGFVNPVDDMHEANLASHPELLQELTAQFVASQFDVKYLIRAICNSRTYQRSSKPVPANDSDTTLFSHMAIKPLSPEQLYDSLIEVVGTPGQGAGPRRAGNMAGANQGGPRANFINFFTVEDGGGDPTEYQAGIPQALRLMNSPLLNHGGPVLEHALKKTQPAQIVNALYLGTLSRRPTGAERERVLSYVHTHPNKPYHDILWALLNTSEFALNH
jgi:hypothetical protein